MTELTNANQPVYRTKLTRRETLKWLGVLTATSSMPILTACSSDSPNAVSTTKGHWQELSLPEINAPGYGKDPNLVIAMESPWPLTLDAAQLTLVAVMADIVVPAEGNVPSASQVNVPDVVDEWVSSPYSGQQKDRVAIFSLLKWIDDEASIRFKRKFVQLNQTQQMAIIDDIAYRSDKLKEEFKEASSAFNRFKRLVLAAFFCSPQGSKDLGYMGNVPITGDYPGPTTEAQAHLDSVLNELGLSEYAYDLKGH